MLLHLSWRSLGLPTVSHRGFTGRTFKNSYLIHTLSKNMFQNAPSSKPFLVYYKTPIHIFLSGHLSTIAKPSGDRRFYFKLFIHSRRCQIGWENLWRIDKR